jgi:hypothetical protein
MEAAIQRPLRSQTARETKIQNFLLLYNFPNPGFHPISKNI